MSITKAISRVLGKSHGSAGTHAHYSGEFGAAAKSNGQLIRAAQSQRKADAAVKAHDAAKTPAEKATHAREAARHASNAKSHAQQATMHSAEAAHAVALADKVHQRMTMSTKEHEAREKSARRDATGPVGPFGVRPTTSTSQHESQARQHLALAEKSVRDHLNARTHVDKLRHAATALAHVKRAEESATAAGHLGLLRRADQVSKLGKLVMKSSESSHSTRLATAAKEHAKRSHEASKMARSASSDTERRLHESAAAGHKKMAIKHATAVVEDFVRHGRGVSHVGAMESLVSELRSRKKANK
jgi:hypothetical protein